MQTEPPNEKPALTVVLADDHAIVREGFAALCKQMGMRIVGQASDGESAVDLILELRPDFAILDMEMPGLSGTQVIRKLRAEGCVTKMLILSISREETTVREAIRAGADGYLLKDGTVRHLEDAIKDAKEGAVYLSPR